MEIQDSIPDLTIVMPVHNEEITLEQVVTDWITELRNSGILFKMIIYNDGSTDRTANILCRLISVYPEVTAITSETNQGHGPTVLRGYREALGIWVLQIDCDTDLQPIGFKGLWNEREHFDVLSLTRTNRNDPLIRRMLTRLASVAVLILFESKIRDSNCPFRLYRGNVLHRMLPYLNNENRVPNIALAGLAKYLNQRVYKCDLPVRRSIRPSNLSFGKVCMLAFLGFVDLVRVAISVRWHAVR
jgi:dolichol-phosphate mannosyltransferase